jgi:NhaA family Na+:H+ antiporter
MAKTNIKEKLKKPRTVGLTRVFANFFGTLSSSGGLLLSAALVSLFLANSGIADNWLGLWSEQLHPPIPGLHSHSLVEWINDGLMTIFFLLVGLEIERELFAGELSDRRTAILPVIAAAGGMVFPALFFFIVNLSHPLNYKGAGIPTATDIAFAIAIMGALGNRVPASLKIFLTALAIIDDLGAILVIAIFYGGGVHFPWLAAALGIFAVLYFAGKKGLHYLGVYLVGGVLMWYCMMQSGIHATMAGVLLAFAIPFGKGKSRSLSNRLEHSLEKPVAFFVLPIFALANTAIPLNADLFSEIWSALPLGIIIGLLLGKPVGIYLFSKIAVASGLASMPQNIDNRKLLGAGILGGIGFTMAIFVANLAFAQQSMVELSKIAVLIASALAASIGYVVLRNSSKNTEILIIQDNEKT